MVARLVWDQDAAGSNPVTSTNERTLQIAESFFFEIPQIF